VKVDRVLTEQEQSDLAVYRSFVAFKATLPDRNLDSIGMRSTVYTIPVGDIEGYICQITVREVSARRDLWAIVFPDNDSTKWCEDSARFVKAELFELYDTCFDHAKFNRLPVIMARIPQAVACAKRRWCLK
jgi:hypothetical protein